MCLGVKRFNRQHRPLSAILIKGLVMHINYSYRTAIEGEMQSFKRGQIDGLTMITHIVEIVTASSDYHNYLSRDNLDNVVKKIDNYGEKSLFKYIDLDHPKNINKPLNEYYNDWACSVLRGYYEYKTEGPRETGLVCELIHKSYLVNDAFIRNRIEYIRKNPGFVPASQRRVAF